MIYAELQNQDLQEPHIKSSDKYKIFQITTQLSDIHQVRYIPSLENMI